MPTKTGDKVRIIVLGTGPDAETARLIAESDADVALAKQFTKTVTHLVVDDTVKPTEARLKKAEEAGVPVLSFAEFKDLLVAGAEDEVDEAAEEAVEAEVEVEAPEVEAPAEVEVETEPETVETPDVVEAEAVEPEAEPEPVAEVAPEPEPEPEPAADPEPAVEVAEAETEAAEPKADDVVEPVAEAIDEPEEAPDDPEKVVPSQAEAPEIENDEKPAKPGLLAKIKSIFGLTGAKK
ncbi:hypothetical protein [Glycomyces rhizosphaerae]|uniref:BRCT domain-containing protein n=1 Tax=Glycomyces rhizosphaerae TaxID=2054422 RepID=A0ABV7PXL2_9ACTN